MAISSDPFFSLREQFDASVDQENSTCRLSEKNDRKNGERYRDGARNRAG